MIGRRARKPLVEFIHDTPGLDYYAPQPARRLRPEWWRQTPRTHPAAGEMVSKLNLMAGKTVRACPGISDLLGLGYIVPLWCDVKITSSSAGAGWDVAAPPEVSGAQEMVASQTEQMPLRDGESPFSIKLNSPWLVRTPPGYSVLMMPLLWHRDHRFEILSGVMDSDVLHKVRAIFKWNLCEDPETTTILPAGMPLMQIIPFRRERYDLAVMRDRELFRDLAGSGTGGLGVAATRFVSQGYEVSRRRYRRDNDLV